eukprot:12160207-Alexandrium_andersonii.AAC.1
MCIRDRSGGAVAPPERTSRNCSKPLETARNCCELFAAQLYVCYYTLGVGRRTCCTCRAPLLTPTRATIPAVPSQIMAQRSFLEALSC